MRRLLPLIATLLLALWLPVTQHCGLEAAGMVPNEPAHNDRCCDQAPPCSHDGCNIVEEGRFMPHAAATVIPPVLALCVYELCLPRDWPDAVETSGVVESAKERPRDWVTSWKFVRRAAPLSRAPSLVG